MTTGRSRRGVVWHAERNSGLPEPDAGGKPADGDPYRDPVRKNQPVVCALHRGLTRGLLDRLAPAVTLHRFVPHDPDRAGCEIDISSLPV